MNAAHTFQIALSGLVSNKMRSTLTVLGVVIGVAAVIALLSIGRGTQAAITSRINSLGTNLLFVTPGATSQGGVRTTAGSASTLTMEDAQALLQAPDVAAVAPQVQAAAQVVAGRQNTRTQVLGVTPEYEFVRNYPIDQGSFITAAQVTSHAKVVVLGSTVAQTLFGLTDPIGQLVKVNGLQYKVIGVLQSKGGTGFGSQDDQMLAPITTVQDRLTAQRTTTGAHSVQTINVQVTTSQATNAAIQEITQILEVRHKITTTDDFTITSQQDTIAALNQSTGVFVIFLGAIAGISLLVGGIGIMNIMLVSVTERTREIGIRKSIGAKRGDIMLQFLMESALLSLTGGGIGILFGWGISRIISGINFGGQTITALISPDILILAVSVSAGIGIIFGLYPAYRAARLNPIDALRRE
ncbi:MAG: ABC transporter permease [Dehalococcoidales bacterium]|nr:ABC transporter permease [Dehalococcoidales bacterium]